MEQPGAPSADLVPLDRPTGFLNRLSPQALFVILAGLFGVILCFLTPPVQVPDEAAHWFRVYQLGQGRMLAHRTASEAHDAAAELARLTPVIDAHKAARYALLQEQQARMTEFASISEDLFAIGPKLKLINAIDELNTPIHDYYTDIELRSADAYNYTEKAGWYGGMIPRSIAAYTSNAYAAISFWPEKKISVGQIRQSLKVPLDPHDCKAVTFPNTALYSVLPYAPQALSMLIARKLKWPALTLLYAGRVGTLLGYLLTGWAAIKITPILKWPACMLLLNPMSLFLAASVSADPISITMAFLATAFVLRCILLPGKLTPGSIAALALLMIAVTLCKAVYFPIAFLVLAIPGSRFGPGYRRWLIPVGIICMTIVTFAVWSWRVKAGQVPERGEILGAGPALQKQWILSHKIQFIQVLLQTVTMYMPTIVFSAVGSLGWLDAQFLGPIVDFLYIALIWLCVAYDEPIRLPLLARMIAGAAIVASTIFIFTATYMVWDKLGAPVVEGIAGRYFLPIGMLFCMLIRRRGRYVVQPKWMLAMLSLVLLYTVWVVVERYYLQPAFLARLLGSSSV